MRNPSTMLCLLALIGCLEPKYVATTGPENLDESSDTTVATADDTAVSEDDTAAGSASAEHHVDLIPGVDCEVESTAWPLRRWLGPDWASQTVFEANELIPTGPWGVAVADFDGDGFHDVYLPQIGLSQLYRNDGLGGLVEVTEASLPGLMGTGMAATVVDLDGDDDLDLVETGFGQVRILMNDGTGHFTVGAEPTVDGFTVYYGSAWADMDGDGDLDGIVSAFPGRIPSLEEREGSEFLVGATDLLLENTPTGLIDASHKLPDTNDGHTFISAWQDLDGDARPEILVMNDFFFAGRTNRVWQFNGDNFDDVSVDYGLDQGMESMGLGITDANGDGLPDLLISGWGELAYMVSDASGGAYISSAVAEGFAPADAASQWVAWAVEYADLDNEGTEEALVTYGHWELFDDEDSPESPNPLEQADALFVHNGTAMSDDGAAWGFADQTSGRGMTVADLNRDGHPDVIRRPVFAPATIDLPRCTGAGWVVIEPRQTTGNRRAIGARVEVRSGEQRWVRWVRAGGTGLSGGGPPEVHVGLGSVSRIDEVVIQWPDGTATTHTDIPTHHRAIITR